MSIFEYLPEFYKAQWSAPLFPFKAMIVMALVFIDSILLSAVIQARKNLSGLSYIFLLPGTVFISFSVPLGLDNLAAILVVTATFVKFLDDEHKERVRTQRFTILYMHQIAEFITMQRYMRDWD